jgi:hypothetical protein
MTKLFPERNHRLGIALFPIGTLEKQEAIVAVNKPVGDNARKGVLAGQHRKVAEPGTAKK